MRARRGRARLTSTALRAALAEGALDRAADAATALYGAEIYGFVCKIVRGVAARREVYAAILDSLRAGIGAAKKAPNVRIWVYTIVRRETARHCAQRRSSAALHVKHVLPVAPFRSSARVDADTLVASLDPDEVEILVLRIDRAFTWKEIARTSPSLAGGSDAAIDREAERLRRRFCALKLTIARAAGARGGGDA